MKKILMALTPILLIGGVTTGVICNNHETKIMQSPQRSIGIDNNEVTTTLNQKVYYDGEDANPDIDGSVTKPISFANKLKKIYLPNNLTNDISASDLLMEYHQSTAPTNDHKQCGYSNNNDNLSFEINERVQDWAQYYFAGLKIKANQFDNKMGLGILPLTLTDHKIWDKDTSYKTIDNPIAFEKDGVIPTVFNNAQEFNYIKGAHQNFENKLETITGAPFCYTKESQHSSGMKVWANRYLWTLQGVNGESSVGYSADSHPVCGVYSLDNLVSINGSSFKNKTITLGINNIMLEAAKKLNGEHENIKLKIKDKVENLFPNNAAEILELVNTNTLAEDNIDALLNYIVTDQFGVFNYVNCFDWLREHSSINIDQITPNNFGPYDDPWTILSDIWNKLNLKIEYAIKDPTKNDQWVNKMKSATLDELTNGLNVPLNKSNDGKYEFKLTSITSDTINNTDAFIYSAESSNIADNNPNVMGSDNIYTLGEEKIVNATFNDNNLDYNQRYYPSQVDDKMLFDTYVNLVTNYGEAADFNILNKDQYQVMRNEITGSINLNITLDGKLFDHNFSGFKTVGEKIPDIDGSLDKFNISGVDLSNAEIIKLLELNKFNSYIANSLNYAVTDDDVVNGIATINVIGCDNPLLHDIYINQTFKVNKLQPYFIQQTKSIDSSLFKIRPSKITMDQFKKFFINMSPEFQNRNLDDLQIDLVPATNTLVSNLSYKEGTTDQMVLMTFTYNGFNEHKSRALIIWIVVSILCAAVIGVSSFLLWKRFHKRDKHSLNQATE